MALLLSVSSANLRRLNASSAVARCLSSSSSSSADAASNNTLTGTVRVFDPMKGYGFIRPDGRNYDLFVHRSEIRCSAPVMPPDAGNSPSLRGGERVRFRIATRENGLEGATAVTWLDGTAIAPLRRSFLGGVYETAHRKLGEATYAALSAEDVSEEEQMARIREAFALAREERKAGEDRVTSFGLKVEDFPTVKTRRRGLYVFPGQVEKAATEHEESDFSLGEMGEDHADEPTAK